MGDEETGEGRKKGETTEKKAAWRRAGHQMLITGCLRFNRQRHRSFDGERGDSLHECGHSYDRRKKNTAQHHLHIYTLAQAQNTLLICREAPVCLQSAGNDGDGVQKKTKKIYNPPQGNNLCDVGILNEGKDIHNICQIEKKSNSSIFFFNLPPVESLRRLRRHQKVPYLATPKDT